MRTLLNIMQDKYQVEMVPYFGLRTLEDQAKLWRQSRSRGEVVAKINELRLNKAFFLSDVLEKVGPQQGPHVTNAIPGFSWHNWGLACDCYWKSNGIPNWDGDALGYKLFYKEGIKLGLTSGFVFSFKDAGHMQMYAKEVPELYKLMEVNNHFEDKFLEN